MFLVVCHNNTMEKSTAPPKWTRDQVQTLIDAYKEEECLYSVRHPNYFNRNIRAQAAARVTSKVIQFRPAVNVEECLRKIHSLRNQFNTENSKRKASLKSGVPASDVYQPSLWYFDSMLFLDNHFAPRKSSSKHLKKQPEDTNSNEDIQCKSEGLEETEQLLILHSATEDHNYEIINTLQLAEHAALPTISINGLFESPDLPQDTICETHITTDTSPALPTAPSPASSSSSSQLSNGFETSASNIMPPPAKKAKKSEHVDNLSVAYLLDKLDKFLEAHSNLPCSKSKSHVPVTNPIVSAMKYATDSLLNMKNKKRQITAMHGILQIVQQAELEELI